MALRNAFQRSSSLLPMRSRPSVIPRALGHRYILPPNAQRYTVQSDRRLWPLVGFVALLGGLEICHAVGKNTKPELSSKNETVTQTHVIPPELIQYALDEVKRQGFPMDVEDKEAYFKQEVSRYEALCRDESKGIEAAICLYRALKLSPAIKDLSSLLAISRIPSHIHEILTEMFTLDPELQSPLQLQAEYGEKEALFLGELALGEALSRDESKKTEAALSLYRALKACQSPLALIDALNKTFPKPVYDVFLAIFALHSESEDQIQYPTEAEEREAFFKQWISRGDTICQDQDLDTDRLGWAAAAMCFYKALKVYPSQKDLMDVYEKLVPTPALDILKEMIALTNAAAIEQIPTKIGEEAYFRKVGEKEACFLQKRTHFMQEVSRGCALCKDQDRDETTRSEAAMCFYRALKLTQAPKDMMDIMEDYAPKPVVDILLGMIARDPRVKEQIALNERANNVLFEVTEGQMLSLDGSKTIETAKWFFRALKMTNSPKDQMKIFKDLFPKPIIDSLLEMIALDPDLSAIIFPGGPGSSDSKP